MFGLSIGLKLRPNIVRFRFLRQDTCAADR
jgi:hypothetical protein